MHFRFVYFLAMFTQRIMALLLLVSLSEYPILCPDCNSIASSQDHGGACEPSFQKRLYKDALIGSI
jgi:hypothetical protein